MGVGIAMKHRRQLSSRFTVYWWTYRSSTPFVTKTGPGSRGFVLTSKTFYMHRLTVHFKGPTVWKWFTSLAAIENHRCPNESVCSYASLFVWGPGRKRFTPMYFHLTKYFRCTHLVYDVFYHPPPPPPQPFCHYTVYALFYNNYCVIMKKKNEGTRA